MDDICFFVPGRCYRRGDQIIRVIGPVFPTRPTDADRSQWREASQEEWDAAVARAYNGRARGDQRG